MTVNVDFLGIFLDELTDTLETWNDALKSASQSENPQQRELQTLFRCAHNLKGSAKSVGLTDLADFVHSVEDYITLMREGHINFGAQASDLLAQVAHEIKLWGADLQDDPDHKRNCQDLLTAILKASGRSNIESSQRESSLEDGIIWAEDLAPITKASNQKSLDDKNGKPVSSRSQKTILAEPQETLRVRRSSIEFALSQLAELSLEISRLRAGGNLGFNEAIELEKIISATHKSLFRTIQGAVDELFIFLNHTCVDVAAKTEKKIQVNVSGSEILLDKKILEHIKDPLMHIVRNAVDHGIESPVQRVAAGKNETGLIRLSAGKSPRGIWIEVADDGQGLNPRKLLAKAIEKSIVPANTDLPDKECFELIFLPGFSTASSVSQFSGRGVGMDVVKKTIEKVNGSIDIDSIVGSGSKFRLFIPAKSSLLDVFIVREGEAEFGIADNGIKEILELDPRYLGHNPTTGCTYRQGLEQIPLLSLHELLGLKEPKSNRFIIVSEKRGYKIGILVDNILSLRQQLIQQPEATFEGIRGLVGTTRLENGKATFVVDLEEILSNEQNFSRDSSRSSALAVTG